MGQGVLFLSVFPPAVIYTGILYTKRAQMLRIVYCIVWLLSSQILQQYLLTSASSCEQLEFARFNLEVRTVEHINITKLFES